MLKILEIEILAQRIRANHEETIILDLHKFLNSIIRNSSDLGQVLGWLKFIDNTESTLEMITCTNCEHFTAGKICDDATIGSCDLGVKWNDELNAQLCKQFSELMS